MSRLDLFSSIQFSSVQFSLEAAQRDRGGAKEALGASKGAWNANQRINLSLSRKLTPKSKSKSKLKPDSDWKLATPKSLIWDFILLSFLGPFSRFRPFEQAKVRKWSEEKQRLREEEKLSVLLSGCLVVSFECGSSSGEKPS